MTDVNVSHGKPRMEKDGEKERVTLCSSSIEGRSLVVRTVVE
jgi:hypothetical protein